MKITALALFWGVVLLTGIPTALIVGMLVGLAFHVAATVDWISDNMTKRALIQWLLLAGLGFALMYAPVKGFWIVSHQDEAQMYQDSLKGEGYARPADLRQ